MNIREMFGMPAVAELMLQERGNYRATELQMTNPELIVGLELEIEQFVGYVNEEMSFRGFTFTDDGSLRNGGIEAITYPMRSKYVPEKLTDFFKHYKIGKSNYSDRTSVHVHVNCQDLSPDKVQALCLLYQVVEGLLFSFVGNERNDNIFCVPWAQNNLTFGLLNKVFKNAARDWQKYTALNLLPLTEKGTVEFRHLEGTCDVSRITTWLNIIGCLFKYIESNTFDDIKKAILKLNTDSGYEKFMFDVFGELMYIFDNYRQALTDGVVSCKMMFAGNKKEAPSVIPAITTTRIHSDFLFTETITNPRIEEALAQMGQIFGNPQPVERT